MKTIKEGDFIEPVVCPFTVAVDKREKASYQFAHFRADKKHKVQRIRGVSKDPEIVIPMLLIPTERKTLKTGDYSIVGYENEIAVERKSLQDLYQTVAHSRGRFVRELERMAEMKVATVVIESDLGPALMQKQPFSDYPPKSLYRSINAWRQRYRTVHFQFECNREIAEHSCFRILEYFWKNHPDQQ